MKTRKKIVLGTALLWAVTLLVPLIHLSPKALAVTDTQYAPTSPGEITGATFDFQSRAVIMGHFKNAAGQTVDVPFKDANIGDGNYNYKVDSSYTNSCFNGSKGITIDGNNGSGNINWSDPRSISSVKATIDIKYVNGSGGCSSNPGFAATINNAGVVYNYYQWDTNNLIVDSTSMGGALPAGSTPSSNFSPPSNYTTGVPTYLVTDNNSCPSALITINTPGTGTLYELAPGPSPLAYGTLSKYTNVFPNGANCFVSSVNFSLEACTSGQQKNCDAGKAGLGNVFGITGTFGQASSLGGGGTGGTAAPTCESAFGFGFEWLICPVLRMADNAATAFNDFIEAQLCFKTGNTSPTAGGVVCDGNNLLTPQVEQAWGAFRVIASSLLVLIMLIMVISQAAGGAMFDAYTVRKVLPKIVIAAILIQLSWYLAKFAIDLANDAGRGIQQLMYAPFDPNNLTLKSLVGQDLHFTGTGANDTGLFLAVLAAGVGVFAVSLPGLLLMALYIVLAVFTAFVVLLLRKMFIILLVLVAPIALILWILPGTESYWKLWSKNFTKLLVMFPLIMAMIATGRIFAYIASGGGASVGSQTANSHPFIQLAIIILAFFAPYFLLPQAFKWGGQAMGLATSGVQKGMERLGKPANEYLNWRKGLSPWKQARAARRAEVERRTKTGFYEGLAEQGSGLRGARGRFRRARLGGPEAVIPGLSGRDSELRGRIVQQAESELDKQRREDEQRAVVQLTQRDLPQFDEDSQDAVREAIAAGKTMRVRRLGSTTMEDFDGAGYARTHAHGQRAALERALAHGQMGAIDQYYSEAMNSGDQGRIADATRFKNDHADVLGPKLTHVLKGYGVAVRATEGEIAQMSGHEIESVIAEFSSRAADPTRSAASRAEAQNELNGFLQRHADARNNVTLRGIVDRRGTEAVDAYTEILTSPNPAAPATVRARSVIHEINTGARAQAMAENEARAVDARSGLPLGTTPPNPGADREANRSRYQTSGIPPNQTIPLIRI